MDYGCPELADEADAFLTSHYRGKKFGEVYPGQARVCVVCVCVRGATRTLETTLMAGTPYGVIPGTRAVRPEARRALGHTSHVVGPGTQAALDTLVARIRRDLAARTRPGPAPSGTSAPMDQGPGQAHLVAATRHT